LAALLHRFDVEAVIWLADRFRSPDFGLGFFDALARKAPEALERDQVRPDLLRAVLVRSATRGFVPSSAFQELVIDVDYWQSEDCAQVLPAKSKAVALSALPAGALPSRHSRQSSTDPMGQLHQRSFASITPSISGSRAVYCLIHVVK
jgi:hypothetical protein